MKKSFLPLLAGLIGLAGVTSASAWTKADPLTLAQQVASNYSSYPLKTFNGGAAFTAVNAEASTDNSFSFTESDDCPSTTTRYYVLGVYDGDAELMHSGNNLTSDYGSSANWCFEKNTDNGDSKCGAKNKGTIKYTNQTPYYLSGLKISKTGACGTITLTKEQMNTLVPNTIWTTLNRPSIHVALDSAYTVVGVNKYPMAPENGPFALANRNHGTMAMYNMKIWKPIQKDGAYISRIEDSQGKAHYIYDSYFALPTPLDVNLLVTGRIQYYYGDLVGYSKYIVLPTIMAERLYYVDGQIVKDTVAIDEPEDLDYTSASSNKKWKFLKPDLPVANSLMELKIWTSYKQEYITQYTRNGNKAFSYFTFNGQVVELDVKHTFAVNAPNIAAAGSYSFIDGTTFVDAVDKDLKLTKATSIFSYLGYSAKLKATPADGYTFKGWYDEKNSKYVSTDETLFVFFTNDTTLTPHFEEVATSFNLALANRTGSSTTIGSDKKSSDFALSKDQISLSATATATGNTKIQLQYCTESVMINCTGTKLKNISSEFTFGSANPNNYTATIATIGNDGKLTVKGTSTVVSLPTNVAKVWIIATMNRYTNGTKIDSKGSYVSLSWKYPVEFVKNDGTSPITTYNVSYGGSVTIPTANLGVPASTGTIRYDYYWQDMNSASTTYPKNTISISNITEAKKIKVVLSTEYLVKFVDFDGNPFTVKGKTASDAEQWIAAGQSATKPASNPDHKQNSDYQFNSWSGSYTTIGEPKTITATYKNKITYATPTNASWKTDWLLDGATPTNYTAPEVAGSRFVGWEPSLANVSGPATYTAKYVKIPKIVFTVNGFMVGSPVNDLEVIAPNECFVETGRELLAESNFTNEEIYGEIYYGISREGDCASNELVQEIDAATGYNAVGITPEITFTDIDKTVYSVAHNIEVSGKKVDGKIVSFDVIFNQTPAPAYLITFKDTDGKTVLQSSYVAKDQMPTAPTSYTIPENTAQYKYSFGNWDPTIEKATKDQTYTAQLKQETQVYTVRFLDADGNQIGESLTVEYNSYATKPDKSLEPKKEGFYFLGWASYGKITEDTDFRPYLVKNPDMSFTVSGTAAGNSTLTVQSGPSFLADGCYSVSKAMLYDKNNDFVTAANPMVAGETYTWKATISTFDNLECLDETSDTDAYEGYSKYFYNKLNSVVPAYVNGVVANDDVTKATITTDKNGYVEYITFDVSYTFVAEAAEKPATEIAFTASKAIAGTLAKDIVITAPSACLTEIKRTLSNNYTFDIGNEALWPDYYTLDLEYALNTTGTCSNDAVVKKIVAASQQDDKIVVTVNGEATYGDQNIDANKTDGVISKIKFSYEFMPSVKLEFAVGKIKVGDTMEDVEVTAPSKCFTEAKRTLMNEYEYDIKDEIFQAADYTIEVQYTVKIGGECDEDFYSNSVSIAARYGNEIGYTVVGSTNNGEQSSTVAEDRKTFKIFFGFTPVNESESSSSASTEVVSSSDADDEDDKNSSSSVKPDDNDKSSSSSKHPKSSSSSADEEDGDDDDDESSSSAKPNAIVAFDIPTFKATVSGRNLSIFGATVGAKTAIFDLQGSVISTSRVEAANFNVSLPRSGMYIVRIGNQIQKVNVR